MYRLVTQGEIADVKSTLLSTTVNTIGV